MSVEPAFLLLMKLINENEVVNDGFTIILFELSPSNHSNDYWNCEHPNLSGSIKALSYCSWDMVGLAHSSKDIFIGSLFTIIFTLGSDKKNNP